MANKTKPKILIIGPRGLFGCEGGIEKFTDAFIPRSLPHANITVLVIHKPEQPLPQGLKVIEVPRSKAFKTDKALYLLYALYAHATQKYDHVFIFGTNFAVLIPLLKMVFWRKSRIHLRSGSIDHVLSKWSPFVRKILMITERFTRFADTVIAVAPSIQKHLQTLGISSHLIRNGVDKTQPSTETPQRIPNTVVAVGRVTSQKNYSVLIRAVQRLGTESPIISIVGGTDLSDEAQKLKNLLRNEDKVTFTGALKRAEVLTKLTTESLYVNCSMHEGMSNAVLEAVQQGIPILLSDIDANRDLSLPDHLYFLPEDDQDLANKIKDALANPKSYTVDPNVFDDWDTTIKQILSITDIIQSDTAGAAL